SRPGILVLPRVASRDAAGTCAADRLDPVAPFPFLVEAAFSWVLLGRRELLARQPPRAAGRAAFLALNQLPPPLAWAVVPLFERRGRRVVSQAELWGQMGRLEV